DTGMIARTDIRVDAEALLDHAFSVAHGLVEGWLLAPLPVQHAFGLGNDDFGALFRRGKRFLYRGAGPRDIIGAIQRAQPFDPYPTHRRLNRVVGGAAPVHGTGREDVLPARRGGIIVVHDDDDTIVFVEYRVAY